jgi:hypothetical protein
MYILCCCLYNEWHNFYFKAITFLLTHCIAIQGYQFWCRADEDGSFYLQNIVTGNYSLYAWVPGFIGDYKLDATLTITSGKRLNRLAYIPLAIFSGVPRYSVFSLFEHFFWRLGNHMLVATSDIRPWFLIRTASYMYPLIQMLKY